MNKINRKDDCRYGFTAYHNVNYSYTLKVLPGIQNLDAMMTPYTKLIAYLKDETLAEPGREQQFANLLTTIHSYLAFAGKSEDSAVGPELGSGFDDCCRRYCSSLGLSERTVRDRRSLLNKWRAAADHLRGAVRGQRSEASTELKKSADFCEQLRSAVARAGVSAKALAKSVHMSPATLTRWLRGAYPNVRARPALARIESFCGLPRGQLSGLLNAADQIRSKASVHVEPVEFRERLSKRIKSRYRLNPREFSDPFLDELKAFYVYKTTRRPAFLRSRKGVWAVSPRDQRPDQPPVLIATDSVCVSFNDFLGILSSFLGFLCLEQAAGGMGRAKDEVQTLAWLAVPEAIDMYMEFLQERSGGLTHSGHFRLAAQILNLTNPQTGYLAQQPQFVAKLPPDVRTENWSTICNEARMVAQEWKHLAQDRSRDPTKPIAGMLSLPEPLVPLVDAIKALDKEAMASPEGSVAEALRKRDALLLSMLIFNPLRIRNYKVMSVTQSRRGYIYRSGKQYRIAIPKGGFKNAKSKGVSDYDVGISVSLTARIDDYLENYRPLLLEGEEDNGILFPNKDTGGVNAGLGRHVFKLTARLIPGCPGIAPHAIRHLSATSWLKNHPDDLITVAEMLNDRLETVLRNYAHLRKDDSLARYATHVEALFNAE